MLKVIIMPGHPNVVRIATRDVREAHKTREALEASLHQCHHQQAELRLAIMQTRIRLAEVMATLRRMSGVMQSR